MAFSGKGKQGEEAQQNEAEEKIVEKATCYFYAQEKIRLWFILDSLSKASMMAWQVGRWPLVTSCHMFPGSHLYLCPACLT